MGYEVRGNGTYYYRKVREGNKVRSVYASRKTRPLAAVFAEIETERMRAIKEAEASKAILRRISEENETVADLLGEMFRGRKALTYGLLLAAGFHTHRGQWRRGRGRGA